jgi:hypothetical protein
MIDVDIASLQCLPRLSDDFIRHREFHRQICKFTLKLIMLMTDG